MHLNENIDSSSSLINFSGAVCFFILQGNTTKSELTYSNYIMTNVIPTGTRVLQLLYSGWRSKSKTSNELKRLVEYVID